jgi:hypothetical protein
MRQHSDLPMRSTRFGEPKSIAIANNRATLVVRRGTWKIQAISRNSGATAPTYPWIFFAVTRTDAITKFPAAVNYQTAEGEILGLYTYTYGANLGWTLTGDSVEIDVHENENIVFYSPEANVWIKYVQVGELPSEDPQAEGGR